MKQTLFIDQLPVSTVIGFYANEREEPRTIIVSVRVGIDQSHHVTSDDLSDVIDYMKLKEDILELWKWSEFYLIETFAEHVVKVVQRYPGIESIWVRAEKSYLRTWAKTVGVELEWSAA